MVIQTKFNRTMKGLTKHNIIILRNKDKFVKSSFRVISITRATRHGYYIGKKYLNKDNKVVVGFYNPDNKYRIHKIYNYSKGI